MAIAGVLVSLSANTFEDINATSADKSNPKLSDVIDKIKDRNNEAAERIKKVMNGVTEDYYLIQENMK